MLEYFAYPVNPTLHRFIRMYMITNVHKDVLHTLRNAKLYSTLLLHFGAMSEGTPISYSHPYPLNNKFIFYNHQSWLEEDDTEYLHSQSPRGEPILCVVFTPIGVHYLRHNNSSTVINNKLTLEIIDLGKQFDGLTEKLKVTNDFTEAIQLVESYLHIYFSPLDIPMSNADMTPVADYILEQNGLIKITDLEEQFHLSRRWLEKQFSEQVGMSPKDFARITRFNALIIEVKKGSSVSWLDMIDKFGYYDQSHLIRDFHYFTGQSPTEFFKDSDKLKNSCSINY